MLVTFALVGILIISSCIDTLRASVAKGGCVPTCGDLDIPYPFGMNSPKCYLDKWFEIECRDVSKDQPPKPYLKRINLEVRYFDALYGTIDVMNPISHLNCKRDINSLSNRMIDLSGGPFKYSQDANKFVSVGCNSIAMLMSNGTGVSGCVSICEKQENINNNNNVANLEVQADDCNGRYCCVTSLPSLLTQYNVTMSSIFENDDKYHASDGGECSYALILVDNIWGRYDDHLVRDFRKMEYSYVLLEWEILNSTMKLPSKPNCYSTNITSSSHNTFSGWRCNCSQEGADLRSTPYLDGGCIFSNNGEEDGENNHRYTQRKSPAKWAIIGVFSGLGSIVLLLGSWWLYRVVRKRIVNKRKEKYFKQNGGLLLEQKLSSGEVNIDNVKHFNLKELEKATDHFNMNRILGKGGQGTVYKGMLINGKIVAVKMFRVQGKIEEFINEFVILSKINHRNVVKLLGCCLETKIPLLVYEFIPNGNLFEYLHDQNEELPMTWDMRLRVAAEIAEALFYLHSAASQPIYHRDIKSTNILLDEKYRAKIADFGASRMISIENTHLTTVVQGTFGYLDPEYFHTSQFTDKRDVYSFGVVLVELLTGQRPICSSRPQEAKSLASYFVLSLEENHLFDVIDVRVKQEGEKEHIIAVSNLAYRCLELNGRRRPTMKEVAIELDAIRKLEKKSKAQLDHEEIELAATEDFHPWAECSASETGPTPTNSIPTSEVMPILSSNN